MVDDPQVASGLQAFGLVIGPAVATLVTAAGFWVARRSLGKQAVAERASLHADPSASSPGVVALGGTVEVMDGEADAAPVTVLRDGKRWRAEARPFLLRLASGVRVRVEPGARPVLRDALDADGKRAALTAGEQVFVRGVLRGVISVAPNAERAVLAAPWWGPLRLSTEAFSGALDARAGELGFQLGMLLITAVGSQLFYAGFYVEALLHWLGRGGPPTIVIAIYFWVALVAFTVVLGSVVSGLKTASPGAPSRPRAD